MVKTLINIIELYIIARVTYRVVRYCVKSRFGMRIGGKGRYKNNLSILGKVHLLISRQIHFKLNSMIKRQKESLNSGDNKNQDSNVVPFKLKVQK